MARYGRSFLSRVFSDSSLGANSEATHRCEIKGQGVRGRLLLSAFNLFNSSPANQLHCPTTRNNCAVTIMSPPVTAADGTDEDDSGVERRGDPEKSNSAEHTVEVLCTDDDTPPIQRFLIWLYPSLQVLNSDEGVSLGDSAVPEYVEEKSMESDDNPASHGGKGRTFGGVVGVEVRHSDRPRDLTNPKCVLPNGVSVGFYSVYLPSCEIYVFHHTEPSGDSDT